MPMRLDDGWNQIQFNLSDFTRRAYGTNYIETLRVQVLRLFLYIDPLRLYLYISKNNVLFLLRVNGSKYVGFL